MRMVRLLAAGKSLVGAKDPGIRYRMTDPRALPKFGSARNPFRSKPKLEPSPLPGPLPPAATVGQRGESDGRGRRAQREAPASASASCVGSVLPLGSPIVQADPTVPQDEPKRASCQPAGGSTHRQRDPLPGPLPSDGRGKGGGWLRRLAGMLSSMLWWRRTAARNYPAPRLTKPLVQGDLSLDKVRVVRNDLSDADLEIVRAEAPAARPAAEPVFQTIGESQPGGLACGSHGAGPLPSDGRGKGGGSVGAQLPNGCKS